MKIEDGKYVELTESEAVSIYFQRGLDDCYSFLEFKIAMENLGCKIIANSEGMTP